jgi:hypothetical protein
MPSIWVGRILMVGVGSFFAGLFLGFRDLMPYLAAKASGVIVRKGYAGQKVVRSEDPDRFARLLGNRVKGILIGFGLCAAGALAVAYAGVVMFGPGAQP